MSPKLPIDHDTEQDFTMSKDNCIKLDKYFDEAINTLKRDNRAGFYDENKQWEAIARKILNVAYGWDLQNLNKLYHPNFPAIDLGDSDQMIGVQVSTRSSNSKINDMLKKLGNEVNGVQISALYNNVYLFVLGYCPETYVEGIINIPENVTFDRTHILDFSTFKERFSQLDDIRQNQILDILETDLRKRPAYELSSAPINFCDIVPNSRDTEIKSIDDEFKKSKNVFLWGMGGIGKTELAVAWARVKESQGESVYLVHYKGSIIDTVCNLEFSNYEFREYERYENEEERRDALFREKLDILREHYSDAIIIIDNFDKESQETSWTDMLSQKGYSELISLKTRFLFTTRFEVMTSAIYVSELSLDSLLFLFKDNAKSTLKPEQEVKAIELINLVDRHTLTVDLMSRSLYTSYGDITIDSLINAFKESTLDERPLPLVSAKHNSMFSDLDFREMRVLGHLKKLFEISNLSETQLESMCHAYLLPETGIDVHRFRSGHNSFENDTLTQSLIPRRWIRINDDHTHLSMHSVIRQVCRAELTPTDENCTSFLRGLMSSIKPHESQYEKKPVYDTVIQAADILEDSTGDWHYQSAKYYRFLGRYETAKNYLNTAIEHISNLKHETSIRQAVLLNEEALLNIRLENYEQAIDQSIKALDLLKDVDNADLYAKINHDLGTAYGFFAEEKRDIDLFKKSLECFNRSQEYNFAKPDGYDPIQLSNSIHSIGNIYSNMGKLVRGSKEREYYSKALNNHLEALKTREEAPNIAENIMARSHNAIGNDYANLKDDKKALEHREKALEYFENYYIANHPDIAQTHSNIAHSYQQLKDYTSAVYHYLESESIYKKHLPQKQKSYVQCEYHLLQLYWEKSRGIQIDDLELAKQYGEQAYKNALKFNDDDLLLDILNVLAEVYGKLGDKEKQLELLVLRMEKKSPTARFSENECRNIANLARIIRNFPIAKKYYEELYTYELNNKPEQYNHLADTLFCLGIICQEMHSFEESLSYLEKAKDQCLRDPNPDKVMLKKIQKIDRAMIIVINSIRKNSHP